MASPQIENGFIMIANELYEAILLANFSKRQLLVVMAIVRKTYGYEGKKEDRISGSQISELTGLRRNHCDTTIKELITLCVVKRNGRKIGIQKDYQLWIKADPKSGLLELQNGTQLVLKQDYIRPKSVPKESQSRTEFSPEAGHTKESKNISKENSKDSVCERANEPKIPKPQLNDISRCEDQFERWWLLYPKKINKAQAYKLWVKIDPDDELVSLILSATETALATQQWIKADGQYIPHPANWLKGERWLDQINVCIAGHHADGTACGATIANLKNLFGGTQGETRNVCESNQLSISRL